MKHPHVSGHSLSNTRSVVRNPFKLPGTNQEPEKWNGSWDGSNTRFLCSPHLVEMAFGPSGDPSLEIGYKSLLFPLDAIPAWVSDAMKHLTKRSYADSAFSGEGARLYGRRFNTGGTPVV